MISIEKKLHYLAASILQHPHSIVVSRLPQVLTAIMINIISIFFLLLLFIIFLLIIMRILGVVDSILLNHLFKLSVQLFMISRYLGIHTEDGIANM